MKRTEAILKAMNGYPMRGITWAPGSYFFYDKTSKEETPFRFKSYFGGDSSIPMLAAFDTEDSEFEIYQMPSPPKKKVDMWLWSVRIDDGEIRKGDIFCRNRKQAVEHYGNGVIARLDWSKTPFEVE